jgi:hypothetical protein
MYALPDLPPAGRARVTQVSSLTRSGVSIVSSPGRIAA